MLLLIGLALFLHPGCFCLASYTTPIWIVYDWSCNQSSNSPSLNDCLRPGPPFLNDLCAILLHFQQHSWIREPQELLKSPSASSRWICRNAFSMSEEKANVCEVMSDVVKVGDMEILLSLRGVHCGCTLHNVTVGYRLETVLLVVNEFHVTASWLSHQGTSYAKHDASTPSWLMLIWMLLVAVLGNIEIYLSVLVTKDLWYIVFHDNPIS